MIKLIRPLVVFDCETTGVDPATDAIFSFAGKRIETNYEMSSLALKCRPWKPIPPEVEELTSIRNSDLANSPPFCDIVLEIFDFIRGHDLCGFNIQNFDLPILWEEIYRCGLSLDLLGVNVVDAGTLFKVREKRTLEAALKFYCGKEHENAHDAMADVQATLEVLEGQIDRYELDLLMVDQLAKESQHEGNQRIDLAGKLVRDKDGFAVYTIGKVKGMRVKDDPSFARWMLGQSFSVETKQCVERELIEIRRKSQSDDMNW